MGNPGGNGVGGGGGVFALNIAVEDNKHSAIVSIRLIFFGALFIRRKNIKNIYSSKHLSAFFS
jgi:hypothetical protein